jgi:hypothetical protein
MSMCRNFKIVSNSLVFLFLFPLLVESVETVKFDSAKNSMYSPSLMFRNTLV